MKMGKHLTLLLLACFLLGCGTIHTLADRYPRNKIYSGTASDFESSWTFMHGGILDWPFSLVADTLLLPYTIPVTISNYADPDHHWKGVAPITDDRLKTLRIGQSSESVQISLGQPEPYTYYCRGTPGKKFEALGYTLQGGAPISMLFGRDGSLVAVMAFRHGEEPTYLLGADPCA